MHLVTPAHVQYYKPIINLRKCFPDYNGTGIINIKSHDKKISDTRSETMDLPQRKTQQYFASDYDIDGFTKLHIDNEMLIDKPNVINFLLLMLFVCSLI